MQVVRRSGRNSLGVNTSTIADNRLRMAVDRFDIFKAKLKQLRNGLRAHHVDLVRAEASRNQVIAALTEVGSDTDSPLVNLVSGNETSYAAIHADNSNDMSARLKEYQVDLISYMANWEGVVTTRIATELKHLDKLFKNFQRYHNKVESLKTNADKKKALKDTDLEKISRNESKLRTARKEYRRNLVSITLLTEEVTERGWKDLLPLLIRMINYDVQSSTAVASRMGRLVEVRNEMEALAERFEMDEDTVLFGRIDTLLEEDAMEFVRPEHREDIDSIQPSVASYIPPAERLRTKVKELSETDEDVIFEDDQSGSDSDSVCPTDEKHGKIAKVHPEVECSSKGIELNAQTVDKALPLQTKEPSVPMDDIKELYMKTSSAPLEHELEEEASAVNYPTSIYFEGTVHALDDDETTLTPYPDMASC